MIVLSRRHPRARPPALPFGWSPPRRSPACRSRWAAAGWASFSPTGTARRLSSKSGERLPLRTLGRAAALVAGIDGAARERERANRLDERIALTRELHEQVIQRLFALSLVLGAEGELAAEDRARADSELQSVLGELRGALERGLVPSERETKLTLRRVLRRLEDEDARVSVTWQSAVRVPSRLEPLAQTVLAEALRNAAQARRTHEDRDRR